MYIFEIKHNDEVIFENDLKEKITKKIIKHAVKKRRELRRQNRDTVVSCPVVKKLKKMVGKPIILDGKRYVFVAIEGSSLSGKPTLAVYSGPFLGNIYANEDSKLYTEDNQGNISLLSENDVYDYRNTLWPITAEIDQATNRWDYRV